MNVLEAKNDTIDSISKYKIQLDYYQLIIENSSDAIYTKDINGIVLSWNRAAEKMYGYSPQEIIGQSIKKIIPSEQNDYEYIMKKIQNNEELQDYETVRKKKDGSLIFISLSIAPLKNSSGKIIAASVIARDISKRKAEENALAEKNKELEKLNKLMIGREMKMIELKKRIKELEAQKSV